MSVKSRTDLLYQTENAPDTATFQVIYSTVVGEITVDPYGDGPAPHVAAFMCIAENDQPGEYRFPMRNGQTCVVHYEYEGEPA